MEGNIRAITAPLESQLTPYQLQCPPSVMFIHPVLTLHAFPLVLWKSACSAFCSVVLTGKVLLHCPHVLGHNLPMVTISWSASEIQQAEHPYLRSRDAQSAAWSLQFPAAEERSMNETSFSGGVEVFASHSGISMRRKTQIETSSCILPNCLPVVV